MEWYLTCPEVALGVLCDEPVELVLLGGGVQRDGLHPNGLAVLPRLVLLELAAADLPGGDIPATHCTIVIVVK